MEIDTAIHCIERFDTKELKEIDFYDPYIVSYPHLINACQLLIKDLGQKSILPISHVAYGWMPTIISYNKEDHEIDKFEKRCPLAGSSMQTPTASHRGYRH